MKYMSKDEVLEFKKFSKSAGSDFSPWNPKNDPELNLWRKTVIKQIAKNFAMNEQISSAISEDNKEGSIEDYHRTSLLDQARRPTEQNIESLLSPKR
jgi:hypothetical protein